MRPVVSLSPSDRPIIARVNMNRLKLFGGAVLDAESGPITGRAAQRHRIALLALLSTTRRLHRSRDQLVTFLWPEADAERGRKLLSDSIYRINQALGGDAIIGTGEDVRLNRLQVTSDVADFEGAIESLDWHRIEELYAGPFLDGFYLPHATDFDQWMENERAQYARGAAKAFEALAVEACDEGRLAESVDWWQRLADLVPDDSRVAMELMRALESAGNRGGALRHARVHTQVLRETLGLEPDRAVRALAEQIARRGGEPVSVSGPFTAGSDVASIAVLPLKNLSESDTNEYFADGVSDELMHLLTRMPGFRVASPTSAFAYRNLKLDVREVARRLHVEWILEGSVRRSGDTLRISAQLTEARTGYQVWSECFDRTSCDVFAIQSEIAVAIAGCIAPAMSGSTAATSQLGARAASDPRTYDLYLQARFEWHRRTQLSLAKSTELFEQVVARDPSYARAWAGLADTYAVQAFYDYLSPQAAFPRADSAARRAMELDPTLAGPYATLAYVDTYYHWDWESAEQRFRRAIELEPTYSTAHQWYASLLAARGRFDEAEREMRRAAELDPLSMIGISGIGWVFLLANQNDRAILQLRGALHLDENFQLAHYWMGLAYTQKGEPLKGIPCLERVREPSEGCPQVLEALARAHATAGNVGIARAMLEELFTREKAGRYISSYEIAKVQLALGDVPAALGRFERAYVERAHSMAFLKIDPQLRSLAANPRFQKLVRLLDQPKLDRGSLRFAPETRRDLSVA
jgi:TolB-like protein/Flp pilus assembly protein TadD